MKAVILILTLRPAGGGSSGWQAPEQLISRSGGDARQGRGTDVFSYGLLLHYCLSGGRHAFGESYERDFNILQARALPAHINPDKPQHCLVRRAARVRRVVRARLRHPAGARPASLNLQYQTLKPCLSGGQHASSESYGRNFNILQARALPAQCPYEP